MVQEDYQDTNDNIVLDEDNISLDDDITPTNKGTEDDITYNCLKNCLHRRKETRSFFSMATNNRISLDH
ncbi:MAG: hypothetical protein RBR67_15520 [Desulfobacterium sp.]|nr:hypothetical protein [Desulfobacterium sp.]